MLQFQCKRFLKPLGVWLTLIGLTWGIYGVTTQGPFLWDDEVMVQQNTTILHPENWADVFTSTAFGESFNKDKFYRPIQILSYMLDVAIWGTDENNQPIAKGFHITSITIHCLNSILFFSLLICLNISFITATLMSLLFCIHPIHIECVTYISGRGDLLFLTFALLSTICFLKASKNHKSLYIASGILFIIGILTKENIIALPVLFLILAFVHIAKDKQKPAVISASILTGIAVAFSLWRLTPGSTSVTEALSLIATADLTHRLLTLPYILVTYIKLLFWPNPLHMEYHYVEQHFLNPYLLTLPLIIAIFFMLYKFLGEKQKVIAGILWFLIALAPVYNIFPKLPSTIREHWVVLPSIGIFWILALGYEKIKSKFNNKNIGIIISTSITLVTLIPLSIATYQRNLDWLDPMRLYSHDVKHEPKSFLLYNNIGVIAFRNGDMKLAEEAFQLSINVSPFQSYGTAYNNLGVILENKGRITDAEKHFEASIKYSAYELGYINLGRILLKKNDTQKAIQVLEEGKVKFPTSIQIKYYLGVAYFLTQRYVQAKTELEWVYRYAGNIMATENLLIAIQKNGF